MKEENCEYFLPLSTSDADSLIRTNSSITFCGGTKANAAKFFISTTTEIILKEFVFQVQFL